MTNGATAVDRLDTLQAVELAEGVEVRLRVAGPLPRMLAYGVDLPYSGPLYRTAKVEGARVRLTFDCAFGGLAIAEGDTALKGFTVAGADRVFMVAQAAIEGDTVVVWSEDVPKPVAVRYAWQYNPACNLANGAGLPAATFRTDDWPFLLSAAETEPDLE